MKVKCLEEKLVDQTLLDLSKKFLSNSLDDVLNAISEKNYPDELKAILEAYNLRINNPITIEDNALFVVTGQQAGIFTGPLYTIYKIISCINSAKKLSKELKKPVHAVYWNATEDHDLSEIVNCYLPGKHLRVNFNVNESAGEALSTKGLQVFIDEFCAELSIHFRDEVKSILSVDFDAYGDYSSSLIAKLFKGHGLIILEPKILRPLNVEFYKKAVLKRASIRQCLNESADLLRSDSIDVPFTPSSGFGLFYINEKGHRRQIIEKNGDFIIDGEMKSEKELLALIESKFRHFSTGAYLRPILQAWLMPNPIYCAGPGELKYHLQLTGIYELFDVKMPQINLRNHATLLSSSEAKLLSLLDLSPEQIISGQQRQYAKLELRDEWKKQFAHAKGHLESTTEIFDTSLVELAGDASLDRFREKLLHELNLLRRKAEREYKRQNEVDNFRVDRLYDVLFPVASKQERRINVFHFIAKEGPSLIDKLIEVFDPNEDRHYWIEFD